MMAIMPNKIVAFGVSRNATATIDDIKVIKDLGENDRVVCGTFL